LAEIWKNKWNPNFGLRKWWLATAQVRELPPFSTVLRRRRFLVPTPSVGTENCGLRCERQLGWYASCRASIIDSKRSEPYDAEFTSLGAWFIKFRSLGPHDNNIVQHPVAFHADGCYEDGIFFIRDAARCDWVLSADTMLISTGGSHQCERTENWGWRVANRFVILTPYAPNLPLRIERCTVVGLKDRPDLNGRACVVEAFDSRSKRYHVFFPNFLTASSSSEDDDQDEDINHDNHTINQNNANGNAQEWQSQHNLIHEGSFNHNRSSLSMAPPRLRAPIPFSNEQSTDEASSAHDFAVIDYGPGFRLALRPMNVRLPPGTRVDILRSSSLCSTTTGTLLSPVDADDQAPLLEGRILHASIGGASEYHTLQYTVRVFLRDPSPSSTKSHDESVRVDNIGTLKGEAVSSSSITTTDGAATCGRLAFFLNSIIPRPVDFLFAADEVVAARS